MSEKKINKLRRLRNVAEDAGNMGLAKKYQTQIQKAVQEDFDRKDAQIERALRLIEKPRPMQMAQSGFGKILV